MTVETIPISSIRRDPRAQPRESLSEDTVSEYADALASGAELPPVTVYRDDTGAWLADGWHRLAAAERTGRTEIVGDVRAGDLRSAILHATGANATHGLRRTNADKRRAVAVLLADEEWSQWSDREIARRTGVSHTMVANLRADLVPVATVATEPPWLADNTPSEQLADIARLVAAELGWTVHPALDRVPMARPGEIRRIIESAKRLGGIFMPVLVHGDVLLDGRARLLATLCEADDIARPGVAVRQWAPQTERDSPEAAIWSANMVRQHLNPGQVAMALVRIQQAVADGLDPRLAEFQWASNVCRRHLSGSQRAMMAARSLADDSPASLREAARVSGCSVRDLRAAMAVLGFCARPAPEVVDLEEA